MARQGRLLWALGVAALLAGCTGNDSTTTEPTPEPSLSLADLRTCSFEYPDGTPVDCSQGARVLEPKMGDSPPGWVCMAGSDQNQPKKVALFKSATAGVYALRYDAPDLDRDARGFVLARGEEPEMYAFAGGPASGWIELPDLPPQGELDILLYKTTYESATPALGGGTLEQRWSWFRSQPWPLHVITAASTEYFLHHVVRVPTGANDMVDIDLQGNDFALTLDYSPSLHASLEYAAFPTSC